MDDMDNELKMLMFGAVDLTLNLAYISRRIFKGWDTDGKISSSILPHFWKVSQYHMFTSTDLYLLNHNPTDDESLACTR